MDNNVQASTPVSLEDLTRQLVWPKLLQSVRLALRPSRLGTGFLVIVVLMGVGTLFDWARGPVSHTPTLLPRVAALPAEGAEPSFGLFEATVRTVAQRGGWLIESVLAGEPAQAALHLRDLIVTLPTTLASRYPFSAGLMALATLALWAIGGGALCRMVAREAIAGERPTLAEALGFVLPRWGRFFAAILGPALAIAVVALFMAVGGLLLLRFPAMDIVGGLLYGLFLLGGALLVFLAAGVALGGALLIPAVAVDAQDAFDAIERAYSYTLSKPLRLVVYAIVLLVVGSAAFFVAREATRATLDATRDAAFAWTGGREELALGGQALAALDEPAPLPEDMGPTARIAASLVRLWEHALVALLAGFALSLLASAATFLYLGMRRLCDGEGFLEKRAL
ncbi:MAG: hypothetical protein D6824_07060 [Planctomycetota bacterium]|nr:MAG: hypothetical protein D6824_07060 [Planctomycetota bacterium]